MTHPHLEGHIQTLREMFAVCANERRMQEADALNAAIKALAALPGGGVVTDEMVERYVNAVDSHLGAMTPKDWEIERFDPAASIRRVARIGLNAALSPTPNPHEADRNA